MRERRLKFNDPKFLITPSSAVKTTIAKPVLLDFARRYYQRSNDKKLINKAKEIKKFIRKINYLGTEGVAALVSDEVEWKYYKTLITKF